MLTATTVTEYFLFRDDFDIYGVKDTYRLMLYDGYKWILMILVATLNTCVLYSFTMAMQIETSVFVTMLA